MIITILKRKYIAKKIRKIKKILVKTEKLRFYLNDN